ncbi:MAG: glycogen debranching enzyme GlgX, partial [Prosthecobacter sp.]|nr:glycogen debranching enzyme GlgX [Prosthecobacter sp.]
DERWHTQKGNNNTYCQDNDLTWLSWDWDKTSEDILNFTREAIAIRQAQPVLARKYFLTGLPAAEGLPKDVIWWNPTGREMEEADWHEGITRCFGMCLPGSALQEMGHDGNPRQSDSVLMLMNAHFEPVQFILPPHEGEQWTLRLATTELKLDKRRTKNFQLSMPAHSLALFLAPSLP